MNPALPLKQTDKLGLSNIRKGGVNPALHKIKKDWENQFLLNKIKLVIQKESLNYNTSISKIQLNKKGRAVWI